MLLKNGKTISIRKVRKNDAAELINYLNIVGGESNNLTFDANGFNVTVEQEEQYIEDMDNALTSVLLVGIVEGRIICTGSISASEKERLAHNGDIGITVLKEFWGQGVGNYLLNALIEFAKGTKKLEIIHLQVKEDNKRAIALYKKAGFQEIGVYPKNTKINGQYFDVILMNLYL